MPELLSFSVQLARKVNGLKMGMTLLCGLLTGIFVLKGSRHVASRFDFGLRELDAIVEIFAAVLGAGILLPPRHRKPSYFRKNFLPKALIFCEVVTSLSRKGLFPLRKR